MTKEDIQILKDILSVLDKTTFKDISIFDVMEYSRKIRLFADAIKRFEAPIVEQPKMEIKRGRNKR